MEFGKFYFKETDFMNCNNTVTSQKSLHMTVNKYYLNTILETFHFVVYKDHSCLFHLLQSLLSIGSSDFNDLGTPQKRMSIHDFASKYI